MRQHTFGLGRFLLQFFHLLLNDLPPLIWYVQLARAAEHNIEMLSDLTTFKKAFVCLQILHSDRVEALKEL